MHSKFYFEYPIDWLKDNKVHQISFIQNIIKVCLELETELVCIPTSFPSYGVKRLSSQNLLISFHSFDNPNNVLSYKEAPINGLFSLDRTGYAGWSDISLNFDHYKQKVEKITTIEIERTLSDFQKQLIEGDSKHPQLNENKKMPNDYILFPLQVRTDSVATHANLDMVEVLKKISYFSKKYKKNIVVKVHPYCNSEVVKAIQFIETEENPYLYTSNAHIIRLINDADKIISCNSGASLEALILGKDVSCFGRSEWYEITNKIENYTDLERVFTSPKKLDLTSFQKKFLTYLLKYYWVKFDDINTIKKILAEYSPPQTTQNDSPSDLYSELTTNLLNKQIELTNSQKRIELVEKDFLFMQEILNYFRRRPWKILKYYLKNRIIKLKKRK